MAPQVVISGAELDRIRTQVATAKVDTAKEVERNHLKHLSDERAAKWPNTISVRVTCPSLSPSRQYPNLRSSGPILRFFFFPPFPNLTFGGRRAGVRVALGTYRSPDICGG